MKITQIRLCSVLRCQAARSGLRRGSQGWHAAGGCGVVMVLFGLVAILVCMQDMGGNGKSTGLVGRIRERIHDWGFRHPWVARPFWYFVLLVIVLGACYCAFNYFDLYHTDADSARYLLSAMVQAQAAIIAIVITLTLIAVQLTASAYSPRVIHVFRNNPDMWLLLGFYGISMLYGLVVLKMVGGGAGDTVSQDIFWSLGCVSISFEFCVSFAYWLEIFTFVALFPYMLNITSLLESENIIKRLATKITKDNILNPKKDPIQPIMDLIHGAVMKYDIATVVCGLDAVTEKAVIDLYNNLDNENILAQFCGHLGRAGRYAVHAGEDESAIEIIGCLKDIGVLTIEMRYNKAAKTVAPYIELIGTFAAEKRLRFVTCDAAASLKVVGTLAAKNQLEDVTVQYTDSLGNVGMYAADNKLEIAAQDAVRYLECVGKCAAKNQLRDATVQALDSLGRVGMYAAENELKYVTSEAVRSLRDVGKAAAKNKLEDAILQAVTSLGDVGTSVVEKGLEEGAMEAVLSLRDVGKAAAKNELEAATEQTAESLGAVGTAAAEKGFERAALEAVWALRTVGVIAAEKGLEGGTMEAVLSLIKVGGITAEKGLEDATKIVVRSLGAIGTIVIEKELKFYVAEEAAWFIDGLTISIEEIPDHDSPQKFMNLYKQRLEELRELRTQKPDRLPHK